jgi:hypothetical protein
MRGIIRLSWTMRYLFRGNKKLSIRAKSYFKPTSGRMQQNMVLHISDNFKDCGIIYDVNKNESNSPLVVEEINKL